MAITWTLLSTMEGRLGFCCFKEELRRSSAPLDNVQEELTSLNQQESDVLLDFVARLSPQWLAGFFDGEGCVGVYANTSYTKLDVNISQKNPGILAIISLKFPAKVSYSKKDDTYHIAWSGRNAIPVLEFIKDYVIVKKRQVELALEFTSLIIGKGYCPSNEQLERREEIGIELKRLKGKSAEL